MQLLLLHLLFSITFLINQVVFDALYFDTGSPVCFYCPCHNRILNLFRTLNTVSIKNNDLYTKCFLYFSVVFMFPRNIVMLLKRTNAQILGSQCLY